MLAKDMSVVKLDRMLLKFAKALLLKLLSPTRRKLNQDTFQLLTSTLPRLLANLKNWFQRTIRRLDKLLKINQLLSRMETQLSFWWSLKNHFVLKISLIFQLWEDLLSGKERILSLSELSKKLTINDIIIIMIPF